MYPEYSRIPRGWVCEATTSFPTIPLLPHTFPASTLPACPVPHKRGAVCPLFHFSIFVTAIQESLLTPALPPQADCEARLRTPTAPGARATKPARCSYAYCLSPCRPEPCHLKGVLGPWHPQLRVQNPVPTPDLLTQNLHERGPPVTPAHVEVGESYSQTLSTFCYGSNCSSVNVRINNQQEIIHSKASNTKIRHLPFKERQSWHS